MPGQRIFYGEVSRDGATLHLKFAHEPVVVPQPDYKGLIMAFVEVASIEDLYAEYLAAEVEFIQKLKKEAWGSSASIVRDPDSSGICFVG